MLRAAWLGEGKVGGDQTLTLHVVTQGGVVVTALLPVLALWEYAPVISISSDFNGKSVW